MHWYCIFHKINVRLVKDASKKWYELKSHLNPVHFRKEIRFMILKWIGLILHWYTQEYMTFNKNNTNCFYAFSRRWSECIHQEFKSGLYVRILLGFSLFVYMFCMKKRLQKHLDLGTMLCGLSQYTPVGNRRRHFHINCKVLFSTLSDCLALFSQSWSLRDYSAGKAEIDYDLQKFEAITP